MTERKCENCEFMAAPSVHKIQTGTEETLIFECRKRSPCCPVIFLWEGKLHSASFPNVMPDDWCGEYSPRQTNGGAND
jgi:hypothetical protein